MSVEGNPAARLHLLLSEAFAVTGHPTNLSARDMWSGVFGLDPTTDLHVLLDAFSSVVALPRHVRQVVSDLTDLNAELNMRPLPFIEGAFSDFGLHGSRGQYVERVKPEVMVGLEHVAELLRLKGHVEPTIEGSDLDTLIETARELLDDLTNAEGIPPHLRAFAIRHVMEVERSLRLVKAEGVGGVTGAVDAFLGEALVRDRVSGDGSKSEWLRTELGRKVLGFVSHAANVAGLATSAPELMEWTQKALGG